MRRWLATCSALASLLLATRVAHAQGVGATSSGLSSGSGEEVTVDRPYWGAGPVRGFAAGVFESAGIGVRTELDLGYGRPHHQWIGVELATALSLRGIGAWATARGQMPWGSVRFGPRFFSGLNQKLIPDTEVVAKAELDLNEGLRSKYLSLDGEVNFQIPLPYGSLGVLLNAYGVFLVPDAYLVFEDALKIVIEPPFVGRARVTYLAGIGNPQTLRIGGLAEVMYNPTREYVNVRIGPAVAVSLTHHFEAFAVAALSVFNRDEIGLAGADLGQIGFRYRWASGDLWPDFP